MREQPLDPGELVVEFRAGLRIAVRRIEAGDQHAVDRRLDVAALLVGGSPGSALRVRIGSAPRARMATPFQSSRRARPRRSRPPRCVVREIAVGRLQLLQADDVRLGRLQPASRLGSRLLMLLMLKVAIFMRRLDGLRSLRPRSPAEQGR